MLVTPPKLMLHVAAIESSVVKEAPTARNFSQKTWDATRGKWMKMVYGAPTCLLNHVEHEENHRIWGYPIPRQAQICFQFLVVALLVCHGQARIRNFLSIHLLAKL